MKKNKIFGLYFDLPWLITVFFVVFIYTTRSISYGKYILIGLALLMLLVIFLNSDKKNRFKLSYFYIYSFLFAFYCLISSVWAIEPSDSFGKGITLFEIFACMSIFYFYFSSRQSGISELLSAVMWAGYLISIYSFFTYGFNTIITTLINGGRLDSTFNNVNEIAGLCSIVITITLFFWLENGLSLKYFLALPSLILLLACGSKRALLCLIICIALLFILKLFSGEKHKSKIKIIVLLSFVLFSFFIIFSSSISSGISSRMDYLIASLTGEGDVDHSTLIRGELSELGIKLFESSPLLGIGIGCPHNIVFQIYGEDFYLHNNFVELLAGGGIFGFAIYYSIYFYLVFNILKNGGFKNSSNIITVCIIVFLLITDIASGAYYAKETHFFIMLCCVGVVNTKKKTVAQSALTNDNSYNVRNRMAYK